MKRTNPVSDDSSTNQMPNMSLERSSLASENDHRQLTTKPFRYYFKKDRKHLALGLSALFLTNLFDAVPPYLIGQGIDQISRKEDWHSLSKTLLWLIGVAIFLGLFRYLWRIYWGRFNHGVAEHLRNQIFDKFLELGPSFYQKHPVGSLMSLITNDVNSFRMAIGPGLLVIADALFIIVVIPPLMMSLSFSWTWKTLILMPIIPPLVFRLLKVIFANFRRQQDEFAALSGVSQEIVSGIRVIKSYVQENNQTQLFNGFSRRYEIACNQVAKADSCFHPLMELSVAIGSAILLFVGAPEVMAGSISIGAFFTFYQYIQRMIWPMTALGIGFNHIQQGKASFGRLKDLLLANNDVPDQGEIFIDHFSQLEVKNLNFSYPGNSHPTLKGISFHIRTGETVGLVGETGSGKSTLIELLCRLYAVSSNTILINGISIEKIRKASLRKMISLVPQDAFLFSKPIQDNIAFSRQDWTHEEIHSVSRVVDMDDEISQIPNQYEAFLGERGVNLSGGQKQRLTIARALMSKASLLIFDDPLSAIDANTEKNILHNLRQETGNGKSRPSLLIASNRISSIKWADRIVVLKGGRVEAIGTHADLLQKSPTYRQLETLQTGRGEIYVP